LRTHSWGLSAVNHQYIISQSCMVASDWDWIFNQLFFDCFLLNILRSMDLSEVALCFADSHHAGDKRKRSQMCYSI
jgi:hypothetical protein